MTTLSKDDVLRIAGECGIDYYLTPENTREMHCVDSSLERFAAAMYAAGAEGMRELVSEQRPAVIDAVAEAIGEAYDCTRVWSAWAYGTMDQDDFSPIAEDAVRVAEIADAAINAIRALPITPANTEGEQA